MVVKGSLKRAGDGVTVHFDVTDGKATVPANFKGITPDLFREGSGVVAEGAFDAAGTFQATNLLAKHDERYMPRELEGIQYDEKSHKMKADRGSGACMIVEEGLAALSIGRAHVGKHVHIEQPE